MHRSCAWLPQIATDYLVFQSTQLVHIFVQGFELHPFQWFPFENFKDCTEVLEEWEARKPKGNSPGKKRKRARQN